MQTGARSGRPRSRRYAPPPLPRRSPARRTAEPANGLGPGRAGCGPVDRRRRARRWRSAASDEWRRPVPLAPTLPYPLRGEDGDQRGEQQELGDQQLGQIGRRQAVRPRPGRTAWRRSSSRARSSTRRWPAKTNAARTAACQGPGLAKLRAPAGDQQQPEQHAGRQEQGGVLGQHRQARREPPPPATRPCGRAPRSGPAPTRREGPEQARRACRGSASMPPSATVRVALYQSAARYAVRAGRAQPAREIADQPGGRAVAPGPGSSRTPSGVSPATTRPARIHQAIIGGWSSNPAADAAPRAGSRPRPRSAGWPRRPAGAGRSEPRASSRTAARARCRRAAGFTRRPWRW